MLFPHDGIAKRDLVDYYQRIAPWMLPHLRERPLSLQRYPDGIDAPGFFQKNAASYYPDWIKTVVVGPDQVVFDLDPSGDTFALVKSTAQSLKQLLDRLGLPAYVKTTGSRGLHVAVPLKRLEPFESVRAFAMDLAAVVVHERPDERTMEFAINRRGGRVFLDINRNAYAQTMAPAFAVRARPGAPVSVPLEWDELQKEGLRPDGFTIESVFRRLEVTGDPWADFRRRSASLRRARQQLALA